MTKVHGKRYAYKFDFHGLMAACQAQAQSASTSRDFSGPQDLAAAIGLYHHPHAHHAYHTHHHATGAAPSLLGTVPQASAVSGQPPVSTAPPVVQPPPPYWASTSLYMPPPPRYTAPNTTSS